MGALTIGVSFDGAESHKRFKKKHGLEMPLAIDDGKVAEAFGVAVRAFGKMKVHSRDTIVIGADGKILAVGRSVNPVKSVDEVLAVLVKAAKKK